MSKKDDTEFNELFRQMGLCLFASQRIEFILQSLVALCAGLFTDKRVNSVSIKSFLEHNEQGKIIRKKTLGSLAKIFNELNFIQPDRLDAFIETRNFIIHGILQPEPITNRPYRDPVHCIKVCKDFLSEAERIENGLKGLIHSVYMGLREKGQLPEIKSIDGWTIFEKDLELLGKNEA